MNYCIALLQQNVQTELNNMNTVANTCQNCKRCTNVGFQNPTFLNEVCSLPDVEQSFVAIVFRNSTNLLAGAAFQWQYYRDDAVYKCQYLVAKMKTPINQLNFVQSYLKSIEPIMPTNFTKLFPFDNQLQKLYTNFYIQINQLYTKLKTIDQFIQTQTDLYIIKLHNNVSTVITRSWNRIRCRYMLLSALFAEGINSVTGWEFDIKAPLNIANPEAAITDIYGITYGLGSSLQSCLSGINEASTQDDLAQASACLNGVINFPPLTSLT